MNSPEVERAVANRMAHQKALITREQALAAGLTDAQIRARVDSERWVRLTKGLYRLAGAEVTWYQRALAPCLVAGPRAVVSHRSAPVVWGLSCIRPGSIEILVPDGYSTRSQL